MCGAKTWLSEWSLLGLEEHSRSQAQWAPGRRGRELEQLSIRDLEAGPPPAVWVGEPQIPESFGLSYADSWASPGLISPDRQGLGLGV
jgi:hypothetical protein